MYIHMCYTCVYMLYVYTHVIYIYIYIYVHKHIYYCYYYACTAVACADGPAWQANFRHTCKTLVPTGSMAMLQFTMQHILHLTR